MAETAAEVAARLAALKEAISSGALRVKYADRDVTYRSLDEMIRIRDELESQVNTVPPRIQAVRIVTRSGWW